MISIKQIERENRAHINIANEPFTVYGRMLPTCQNRTWGYETVLFPAEEAYEMCFPDENYDYDAMCGEYFFLGAYEDGRCIGLAILQRAMFKHMYLYDLKVCREYRGKGVGGSLIRGAKALALSQGYGGIYTIGQDNNLAACLFYIKEGFEIGGYDTRVYHGTNQQDKADIIFYLSC